MALQLRTTDPNANVPRGRTLADGGRSLRKGKGTGSFDGLPELGPCKVWVDESQDRGARLWPRARRPESGGQSVNRGIRSGQRVFGIHRQGVGGDNFNFADAVKAKDMAQVG